MNSEQIASLLRTVLQVAGGFAVGRGWVDNETAVAVSGAIVTLAVTAWSLYARRTAGLVASAAALPEVRKIEAAPKVADAVPSDKVRAAL